MRPTDEARGPRCRAGWLRGNWIDCRGGTEDKGGGHWLVGCDEQWSGRTGVSADLSGQPAGKFMRLTGKKDRRLGGLTGGMGGLIG